MSYPLCDFDFWKEVKNFKKQGWEIAMHGYEHLYHKNSKKNDYLGHGGNTEFVGDSYDEQFKKLNQGITLPFLLTMMYIPNLIIKLLPFIIFISSMIYLISIKSNKDLLSLKIFGYSNLKIISILSITSFLFGILTLFIINPVTSSMVKYYEKTKAKYSKDIDHLVSINKNGVWIKELNKDSLRITTAEKIEEKFLKNVTIYELSNENKIINRIHSDSVNITNNIWTFEHAEVFNFKDDYRSPIKKQNFSLSSNYNIDKLNTLYKNLDTVSFLSLLTKYEELQKRGYSRELLDEKLNNFISLPVFLFLMVVLASIFSISSISRSQNTYYIFISIIACAIIYYFKDLSIALGQTNRIPLSLSVWMPIIAVGLFCSIGVLQINEK